MFPELKYTAYNIRLKESGRDRLLVFDAIRKKWLQLTPEEWVRQHVVNHLISEKGYPASLISVEKEIELNGTKKRYDIVVYSKDLRPCVIIECKAPDVELTQEVLAQASRYNLILGVDYLVITNGLKDQIYKAGKITDSLPPFDELSTHH